MRADAVAPAIAAILLGCGAEEPVLTGMSSRSPQVAAAAADAPREPIYLDVSRISGRPYDSVREVLLEQAGALVGRRDVGGRDDIEVAYQRATVRVVDGAVAMVRIPLPEPMRPGAALATLGFSGTADDFIRLSGEYRLNHAFGQRRIRLKRGGLEDGTVTEVECWHHDPTDGGSGR